jgi:hypothetical protein
MGSGTIQVPDLSLQPRARAPPSGRRRPPAPKQIYLRVILPTRNSEEASDGIEFEKAALFVFSVNNVERIEDSFDP